jgi:NADPH:quinone reductase-like Zn-dependent oxidoreductase
MDHDDGRGAERQGALHHLARIDGRVIDGAALLLLVGDERVLLVEEEQAELLVGGIARSGGAIVDERLPGADHGTALHLGAEHAQARRAHGKEPRRRGVAHARRVHERLLVGAQYRGEAAEALDQRFGKGLGIGARQSVIEQEFEELVIRQRLGARFEEALAQPLAVTVIMRLLLERRLGRRCGGGTGSAGGSHGQGAAGATIGDGSRKRPRRPGAGNAGLRVDAGVVAHHEAVVGEEALVQAMLLMGQGGPEMLRPGDAPDPVAGPGEVVVDIHAASVNAADYKVRRGSSVHGNLRFPHILGRDFSGVVASVGPGVTDLAAGDAVFGVTEQGREGAYAEKIAIKAAIVAKKPDRLGHDAAAALALTGITALWALEETARLKAGEKILIQGGAGGVASFAIQLAKHIGARVITTASAGNHAYVRDLGADQVIDYRSADFTKAVSHCDVVFDTVGGEVRSGSYSVLKPGGRLVWIAPAPEGFRPPRSDVETLRPNVARDRAHLERIVALVESGAVRPPAITRYPLADAAEAHRVSEARHLKGKLVLMVR